MRKFEYRFEKLVQYVERKKQEAEEALRREIEVRDRIQTVIGQIVAQAEDVRKEIRQLQTGSISIPKLLDLNKRLDYLIARHKIESERLAMQNERVKMAQEVLREREQELDMFEKLKEKQRQYHLAQLRKEEQKLIDEMALARY